MRFPAFIAALCFGLAFLVAFSQPAHEKRQQAERLQKQGETALERASYKEALSQLEASLELYEEMGDLKGVGDCLRYIGQVHRGLKDYPKARDYYARALRLHEKIGDEQGMARDLTSLGIVYQDVAEYKEAMTYLQRAVELARRTRDDRTLGRALNGIGTIYYRKSDYKKAIEHYEQAAGLAHRAGDKPGEAQALQTLAVAYNDLGERQRALDYDHRALEIYQGIGDRNGIANVIGHVGIIYGIQGDYNQARKHIERALKLREEIGDKKGLGGPLNSLGLVSQNTGDYKAAINYFQRAISISEEVGNKHNAAYSLGNLAGTYYLLAEYEQALDQYRKALKVYEEVGDKGMSAQMLMNIGLVHGTLGNYQAALEHYEKALATFQEVGAKDFVENVLNNIGEVYNTLGDYPKALDYFQRMLELDRELGYKHGDVFNNLGTVYANSGKVEEARRYFEQALRADQQIGAKRSECIDLHNLGELYKKMGRYDEALNYFKREAETGRQIGDPERLWKGLFGIGQCQEAIRQSKEALASYVEAIGIIESIRSRLATEEHKIGFVDEKFSAYESIIDLLLKLYKKEPEKDYAARAFGYVERVRARALLELLAEAHVNLRDETDKKLLEMEKPVLNRISDTQRRLLDAKTTEEKRKALLADLERLEGEHDELKREMRRASPKYSQLWYPQPLGLSEVQSDVLERDQALLEYFLGDEKSSLWLVRKDKALVYELPSKAELEKKVRLYLELISERLAPANTRLHYEGSQRLYRELIAPAAAELLQIKSLTIVPDGILYYLPFETLMSEETGPGTQPRYLIENYAVSYVPSASILAYIKMELKGRAQPTDRRKGLLAFGDPVYPARALAAEQMRAPERGFAELRAANISRLPYSAEEVQRISRYFPKGSRKVLLREQASEEQAKSAEIAQFKIVHFAAHGLFDEQRPRRSGILLSLVGQGEEDGFLQVDEIFNLKLNADLVVLSACQTALGQMARGEGIVGLARVFMYAGTPSLVASLWNVNDKASADFMDEFYALLRKGESKAQALRQAKRRMMAATNYAHPYYWGPFILIGESASPIAISRGWLLDLRVLTIAVILFFFAAAVIFRSRRKRNRERLIKN